MLAVLVLSLAQAENARSAARRDAQSGPTAKHDPNQILRYSEARISGAISPVNLDPVQMRVQGSDFAWGQAVYSTLIRPTASGEYVPDLATEVKIVNPSRIDITLRRGVVFSDGAPFNAQAVKFGLERNLATKFPAGFYAPFFQIQKITVTGSHSLRLDLKSPVAGMVYSLLADTSGFIVSPKAAADPSINLNRTPVGAGPFLLVDYDPSQRMVFRKNPRYWDAKNIKLAGLEMVNVAAGPQQANALRTNQTQLEYSLAPDLVEPLKSAGYPTTSIPLDGNMLWMPMCKSVAPFNKLAVRKALNYGTDKKAIIEGLLGGKGQPMDALWPKGDKYFPKDLEGLYAYDLAKARQLLASAGYAEGFTTTVMPQPGNPISAQVAQIIQEQWKKLGITVTIVPTTNFVNDFYLGRKAQLAMNYSMGPGMIHLNGPWYPGSIGNACQYDSRELNKRVAKFNATAFGSPQSLDGGLSAQRYILNNALSVFISWLPFNAAWHPNLRGVEFIARARPLPDLWKMYFVARK